MLKHGDNYFLSKLLYSRVKICVKCTDNTLTGLHANGGISLGYVLTGL